MSRNRTAFALGLICLLFAGCHPVDSNSWDTGSLRPHSYLLFGYLGHRYQKISFGTVCFVRVNQKLFLLGALHELTGVDYFGRASPESLPDSVVVVIDNDSFPVGLPVNRFRYKTLPAADPIHPPHDLFAMEIRDPKPLPIHSLEKYLASEPVSAEPLDSIISFGYVDGPDRTLNAFLRRKTQPLSAVVIANQDVFQQRSPIPADPSVAIFRRDTTKLFAYYQDSDGGKGRSGAPVFLNRNGHAVFCGIVVAADLSRHILIIEKSSSVLALLKKP